MKSTDLKTKLLVTLSENYSVHPQQNTNTFSTETKKPESLCKLVGRGIKRPFCIKSVSYNNWLIQLKSLMRI